MSRRRYTQKQVADALLAANGIMTLAAEMLGTNRETLRSYLKAFPDIEKMVEDGTERLLDKAESNVKSAIDRGDLYTSQWYLSRKGKGRGYCERSEITGKDGEPVKLVVERRTIKSRDDLIID
jgi:hypothetical protein